MSVVRLLRTLKLQFCKRGRAAPAPAQSPYIYNMYIYATCIYIGGLMGDIPKKLQFAAYGLICNDTGVGRLL